MGRLFVAFCDVEMALQVKVWFGRVPTSSNVADAPSRFLTADLDARGALRSVVEWNRLGQMVKEQD